MELKSTTQEHNCAMLVFLSSVMLPLTETSLTSTTEEITSLRKTQLARAGSALRGTHHPNSGCCITTSRHPRDLGGLFSLHLAPTGSLSSTQPLPPAADSRELTGQECPAEPSRVRYVVNGQTFSTSLSLGSSSSKVIRKQWTKTWERDMKPQRTAKFSVPHTTPAMPANQSDCIPQIPSKPLADALVLLSLCLETFHQTWMET